MTSYTAAELIGFAKAYIAAEATFMSKRPAGVSRIAWRIENPINLPISFDVRDTARKPKPACRLTFDLNGDPYDLRVWSNAKEPKIIENINLRAADADERLLRYERI